MSINMLMNNKIGWDLGLIRQLNKKIESAWRDVFEFKKCNDNYY
jgi:hypothetical protein